ncbi:MAG: hypothetical protein GX318_05395 [Clostridia bacterium]|nr:hypothetical protein [Clostridia bacterium]
MKNADREREKDLLAETEELLKILHSTLFGEHLEFLKDTKRLFILNFLLGLIRGLGMAIGFTILGAFVFYILRQIVVLNLPLISDFIAEIIRLVITNQ